MNIHVFSGVPHPMAGNEQSLLRDSERSKFWCRVWEFFAAQTPARQIAQANSLIPQKVGTGWQVSRAHTLPLVRKIPPWERSKKIAIRLCCTTVQGYAEHSPPQPVHQPPHEHAALSQFEARSPSTYAASRAHPVLMPSSALTTAAV